MSVKKIGMGVLLLAVLACNKKPETSKNQVPEAYSFGKNLEALQKHQETIVLSSADGQQQVAVIGAYQGRVMTSTSNGLKGQSYGWLNHDLIASGEWQKQINVFGGEDRFWLGPEGGQYSIFFPKDSTFTIPNWQTPAPLDTEPFELVSKSNTKASFKKQIQLKNYQGFEFNVEVNRRIELLDKKTLEKNLSTTLNPQVNYVGYQSVNTIKNTGTEAWSKDKGLLSIWILGMFNPSENTTIIIPYKDKLELNTSYFGEIDATRLSVIDHTVLLKADGNYRCKIGLPPANALPVLGSYDAKNKVLTIVQYSLGADTDYVNSLWKLQEQPYGGDVVNAYNDGPMDDGSQLGPFYELESSSAAKALLPQESLVHVHKTYHFEGDFNRLNQLSQAILDFDLSKITFKK